MENKELNQKESLDIINGMITQAKNNLQQGAATATIIAGYSVAVLAIANYILMHYLSNPYASNWVWLLMIPATIVIILIDKKREKSAMIKTHIDKIIANTWNGFTYSVILLLTSVFALSIILKAGILMLLISPIILIMTSLAQYITATACRFRPYFHSALIFAIGSLLCILCYYLGKAPLQFIILAVAYILGFVIPGNMLNKKAKQNV